MSFATWFMIVSGALTALAGLGAALAPSIVLRFGFDQPPGPMASRGMEYS